MEFKLLKRLLLPMALSLIILFAGGSYYFLRMKRLIWEQSVSNALEVSIQGGKAFECYMEQGLSMMENQAVNFAQYRSEDRESIEEKLDLYKNGDLFFSVIDLTHRQVYLNSQVSYPLSDPMAEEYLSLPENGILEPFISEYMGRQVYGYYEKFTFKDGAQGMVRQTMLLSDVSEQFALSFYDGEGSSYIVSASGEILLRLDNENGNKTFLNIFDVVALDHNTNDDVNALRKNMSGGKKGVMCLNFTGEEHIFAFVPLNSTNGWYLVSIIPNDVIMDHAGSIIMSSQIIVVILAIAIIIFAAFFFINLFHRRQVKAKDTEVLYREQLFDLLANNTNDVFLMLSADRKTVEYVSPNVKRVTGVDYAAVAKDIRSLNSISQENAGIIDDRDIPLNSSVSFEGRYIHKNTGETRWYTETIYHTVIMGVERYIIILADRSEERQKEAALTEALNIAKIANEAKSAFLSNMSHDIRTPMNAIVSIAMLLRRDADNPVKVREHTEKIDSSSRHLLGLINDVLDMSKIENGKTSLNVSEFPLPELIQELDSIIRLQSDTKKQSFDIKVRDVHHELLLGDRQRISQVMINILSNAVKYTPEGGHVVLTVYELSKATQDIAHIRFVVEDNGIGMSEEYQNILFQPFTREVRTTVNQVQGTGLGMAITKNLVELMGGTISVKSQQGVGSTFTIDLDLGISAHEDNRSFWKNHGISKAIVVDDEQEICTEVLRIMSDTGVEMQYALDGASAVEMVKAANNRGENFDVIILDWKMPGMDGIHTAKQIRAAIPVHIPIMILSSYDWEDIREESNAAGIDGFLAKPFFLSSFMEVLRSVYDKNNKEVSMKAAVPMQASIAGMHFLCADDNELNVEILAELLDMEGASADVASNGKEAVEMFAASCDGTYDAVLMDVQMPVMNGFEATKAIRLLDHPQAKSIPIVAVTANAFSDDIRDVLEAGMNAHIAKPVDMPKLVMMISSLCEHKP